VDACGADSALSGLPRDTTGGGSGHDGHVPGLSDDLEDGKKHYGTTIEPAQASTPYRVVGAHDSGWRQVAGGAGYQRWPTAAGCQRVSTATCSSPPDRRCGPGFLAKPTPGSAADGARADER